MVLFIRRQSKRIECESGTTPYTAQKGAPTETFATHKLPVEGKSTVVVIS